jgi:sugar/nucleoside kinase (ribokinase family)
MPTELYHHGSKTTHPVPPATVVNAIGGGDAFAAGVVAGLETGHEIRHAIMIGQAAAGIIVEQLACQLDRVNWRDIDSRRGASGHADETHCSGHNRIF